MSGMLRKRLKVPPKQLGDAVPMMSVAKKYCDGLEQNQKIKLCCRHMENVTARFYKTATQPEHLGPDLLISTCGKCGCNHYRFMVGAS